MAARKKRNGGGGEQVELLRAIWSEMKALNSRVDHANARLGETNVRLDAVRLDLKQEIDGLRGDVKQEVGALRSRVVESEVRLATVTTSLSGNVQELSGLIREWREEHRADRAEIRARLTRLEQHIGLGPKG